MSNKKRASVTYRCPHCKKKIAFRDAISETHDEVNTIMESNGVEPDMKLVDALMLKIQELYPTPRPPKDDVYKVIGALTHLTMGLGIEHGLSVKEILYNAESKGESFVAEYNKRKLS